MPINEKYIKILELDKILEKLSTYANIEEAKTKILNLKPHTELDFVKFEAAKTCEAFYLSSKYGTPSFIKLSSPEESIRLASMGGTLMPSALLNCAGILRQSRMLLEWFEQCSNRESPLKPIFSNLRKNQNVEERISTTFVGDDEIDDFASPELLRIRRKIRSLGAKIKQDLDKMIRSTTYQKALQENIVTQRDGRYVVPVKAEYKSTIGGLVHDTSSSGATLFVEPMSVVESNNEIKVLSSQEKQEIDRIMLELSGLIAEQSEVIKNDFDIAVILNIYFAKANLAESMRATMPEITDNGIVKLNKARHPLISKDVVVPIDLEIGKDYTSLVITGPNTGGKTVTLKTIGLFSLMVMCGLMIPATDGSIVSVFDNVLADIGDEQSIAQSLSTFSSHMTNIVSILDKADNKSLVLVDELGSGTDPVEGAALAVAILENLRKKGAIVAATTHYAELKIYALQTEGVKNASCEFDVKTLRPTYRLLIGTPGRSNAFEISKRLGINDDILNEARLNVENDKQKFEDTIDTLESARQEYEEKAKELEQKNNELKRLKEQVKDVNKDLLEQRDKLMEKAREESRLVVEQVRRESEKLIDELTELRKQKERADFSNKAIEAKSQLKSRLTKLQDLSNPVEKRTNENYILPRPLKKGDEVLLVDINKTGTVIDVSDGKKNVLVQTGIMKTRTPISNLQLVENKNIKKEKGKVTKNVTSNKNAKSSMEVNLRGMTVEEAIMELDMFLNRSLLSNIGQITIIHGKGTGALRQAVHQYLKQSKHIKTYRLGVYGEGETGVTIAELK